MRMCFHNLYYISLTDLFKVSTVATGRASGEPRMFAPSHL